MILTKLTGLRLLAIGLLTLGVGTWAGSTARAEAPTDGGTIVIGDSNGAPVEVPVALFGDIAVTGPWARATNAGSRVGGVYFGIENRSASEIRLLSVATPVAQATALNDMPLIDKVARIVPVEGGIAIPPGGKVELRPGGLHVMLKGLTSPLRPGARFPMTLEFSNGTSADVEVQIWDVGAMRIISQ
ncbi:copper chaperone PCu(A)C [Methylobrevis pamukkalensis]|uniref:Copper chaperone PCu(A)C n=1 Tax=Methylobrevis pamukkalensis TaxID=1439726 RepID=A0A1E3H6V6_9HYPH|nr:copper chaperone PCu(A)C [Methylobrevis pamukkalensis]ODN72069.1 hypothetical protein A6302_00584 [Methylobrevis pamukkalensis]